MILFQHEMIHAYLFVTDNYKDRSDHGPEFHKHMYRINNEAGTNITVSIYKNSCFNFTNQNYCLYVIKF